MNALIRDTFLGIESHNILTFNLELLTEDDTIIPYGFYRLDKEPKADCTPQLLRNILETTGVSSWEELKGKIIRIKIKSVYKDGKCNYIIGHILKEKWFDISEFIQNYKKGD